MDHAQLRRALALWVALALCAAACGDASQTPPLTEPDPADAASDAAQDATEDAAPDTRDTADAAPDAAPDAPAPGCTDDAQEDDGTVEGAPHVDAPLDTDGVLCPDDARDLYVLDLRRNERLTAALEFGVNAGDLDLQVRAIRPDGTLGRLTAAAQTDRAPERLQWDVTEDGRYALEVVAFEDPDAPDAARQAVAYRLTADVAAPLACADDGEDDDTRAQAQRGAASPLQGVVCADDPDWIALDIAFDGATVTAALDADVSLGGARVTLHNADGAPLGASASGTPLRVVDIPQGAAYLHVEHVEGTHTPYTLTWSIDAPLTCDDDAGEPDDSPQTARDGLAQGDPSEGIVCGGDVDWFTLGALPSAGIVRVDAQWLPELAPPRVEITTPTGDVLAAMPPSDTPGQGSVTWQAAADARPLVRVSPDPDATQAAPYTLTAAVVTPPDGLDCAAGPPDDTPAQAQPLEDPQARAEGSLCTLLDPSDLYRVTPEAGQVVYARLEFNPAYGDLDLVVLDATGTLQEAASRTALPYEELVLVAASDAPLLIQVTTDALAANAYALDVQRVDPPPCEDAHEPNNTPAEAASAASPVQGVACASDPDVFAIEVPYERAVIEASVAHNGVFGDLDMVLLDPSGQDALAGAVGIEPNFIWQPVEGPATYPLRVDAVLGASVPYELIWTAIRRPGCDEDPYEPNDDTPTPLDAGIARGATLCGDDVDLYPIHVPDPNTTLALVLDPYLSEGFARLELLDTDANTVLAAIDELSDGGQGQHGGHAGDERPEARLLHTFVALEAPGTYIARVTHPQGDDVAYDLTAGRILPPACPSPLEPNNKPIDATPLAPGVLHGLTLCADPADNEDWFTIDMTAGQTLRLLLLYDAEGPDVTVYASDAETPLLEAFSAQGELDLRVTAPDDGPLYVVFSSSAAADVPFSVAVEVSP